MADTVLKHLKISLPLPESSKEQHVYEIESFVTL